MTHYNVDLSARAAADLRTAYERIRERSPLNAQRWKDRLERKIASLEHFPERCGYAAENEYARVEIRQLLFGNYRALFTIRGNTVHVLTIRHTARRDISPDEIERLT